MTEADASIYRGEVGPLPRGKYVATLMFKAGDSEKILEQREFATAGSIPADSAELRIKPPNLELLRRLSTATHGAFDAIARDHRPPHRPDRGVSPQRRSVADSACNHAVPG